MSTPETAVKHYRAMLRLQRSARAAAAVAWSSLSAAYLSESWDSVSPALVAAVSKLQLDAATRGAGYGGNTLADQGLYEAPEAWVDPSSLAGVSSRGASLGAALYSAIPHTKDLIAGGMPERVALSRGREVLQMSAAAQVADAGRTAAGLDTFARPKVGYVRMLNPPSCSRCSVLAGRFYRSNEGFRRHPRCDCVHVPTTRTEAASSEGLVHDPYAYFESLSEAAQDKTFGKAQAQAIRDGADLFQVVNARRGMSYAGVSSDGSRRGQRVASDFTREGTTRRALWGGANPKGKRLTPDAIYAQGLPREATLDLLAKHGYLLPQGQVAEGAIRGAGPVAPRSDLTAAEKRLQTARLRWEAVQDGRNPHGRGPLTPDIAARVEGDYRRWLASNGQIHTD
nr:MAG TPA: hypothetical protein [Caudoviricetes sp.]